MSEALPADPSSARTSAGVESAPDGSAGTENAGTARASTLRDVASRVGVSPRTVSRVVNDEGGCSTATRQRILDAIEELRYRPNLLARGLISGRSGTVGLVGDNIDDPFFAALADGILRKTQATNRSVFFATTDSDSAQQGAVLKSLWSHAVEGVIVCATLESHHPVTDFASRGLPIVVVGDAVDAANVASVCFNVRAGARLGVQHLLDRGRRRLGLIGSSAAPAARRLSEDDFTSAVAEVSGAHAAVVRAEPTVEGGRTAMGELLERRPDLDGIIAHNDLVAIGAMGAAGASGRSVPDDIAVVGIDDIEMSAFVTPSLTTVRLDQALLAERVMHALNELIDRTAERRDPVVIPTELVVRDSA